MGRGRRKPDEKQNSNGETNPSPGVDSRRVSGWTTFSPVIQAITTVVLVFITTVLMCQSNKIARQAIEVVMNTSQNTTEFAKEIRRYEVRPVLRLAATRWYNIYAEAMVIRVKNVGDGSALDLNVILKESGHGYCQHLIHRFYPIGVLPRLYAASIRSAYVPVEPELDSMLIRDFILPGEELEFQYGSSPLGHRSSTTTLTLYLSYYDTDGNEYLTITSLVPGENTMKVALNKSDKLFDSLDQMEMPEVLNEYKTLVNPGMRERGRFWGVEKRWLKSDESEP